MQGSPASRNTVALALLVIASMLAPGAAAAAPITLLCKGDALTGRLVIDTGQRIFQGIKEGTRKTPPTDSTGPDTCNAVFLMNDASYGVTEHCEGPDRIGADWVDVHSSVSWLVDRSTGHLDYEMEVGLIHFSKTAECAPMDPQPKF